MQCSGAAGWRRERVCADAEMICPLEHGRTEPRRSRRLMWHFNRHTSPRLAATTQNSLGRVWCAFQTASSGFSQVHSRSRPRCSVWRVGAICVPPPPSPLRVCDCRSRSRCREDEATLERVPPPLHKGRQVASLCLSPSVRFLSSFLFFLQILVCTVRHLTLLFCLSFSFHNVCCLLVHTSVTRHQHIP